MTIYRVHKNKNYTTMSNHHLKDKRISLKAKGLLSQMLSLPDDWKYSVQGLVAINKEKEGIIKSTLDELKINRYLIVTKINNGSNGKFEYVYDIYEKPPEGDLPGVEKPGVVKPGLVEPAMVKQVLLNTNILNTNNKKLKNNINIKSSSKEQDIAKSVIDHLNSTCNKHFRYTESNLRRISSRLKEGYTLEDLKDVVNKKSKEWLHNDNMNCYLRPETLFGNKFESYLNQKEVETKRSIDDWLKEE